MDAKGSHLLQEKKNFSNAVNLTFETLVELLQLRALQQPHQPAFTFLVDGEIEAVHLTYAELDLQARAIAASLQARASVGERVLLLYPSGLDFIAAFFGCLYAGAIAVPVNLPRHSQHLDKLQAIALDAQPKFALTTTSILSNLKPKFDGEPKLSAIDYITTDTIPSERESDWTSTDINSDTLAFLQYTSGSTRTPKGVMVNHGNLLHNLATICKFLEHTPQSKTVTWLPLYHDMGLIGGVLQPLFVGFPLIMISPVQFLQKPLLWLQAISRYQATSSGGPNFAYDLCIRKIDRTQQLNLDLSSWDIAFTGAEPIRAETLEQFTEAFAPYGFQKKAFYPCYGLAEATLFVCGGLKAKPPTLLKVQTSNLKQNRVVLEESQSGKTTTFVSCGKPDIDQKVLIVNPESLQVCPAEEIGEIWVASLSVAQGYWGNLSDTKYTFQAYLKDGDRTPFLRTGDLGFMQDGELFITGRLKDLIIIRGRNYYPQDIEYTVEQSHSSLRANCSAAFSIEVEGIERLAIVAEVERHYRSLNLAEVINTLRDAVTKQHEIEVYGVALIKPTTIPKTTSGKIQRHTCREKFLA